MSFGHAMQVYVEGQRKYNKSCNTPQRINISNLNGILTDRLRKRHRDSRDLVVISHPGFSRLESKSFGNNNTAFPMFKQKMRMNQRRRVDSTKSHFALSGQYAALRQELVVEDLIGRTPESVPIVITVPSYEFSPLQDHKVQNKAQRHMRKLAQNGNFNKAIDYVVSSDSTRSQIISRDNNSTFFLNYLQSLVKDRTNVYLLPTLPSRGVIIGDIDEEENIFDRTSDYLNDMLRVSFVDGKPVYSISEGSSLENRGPVSFDFDFGKLLFGGIDENELKGLENLFGEAFIDEVRDKFGNLYGDLVSHWSRSLTSNPLVTPLLEPLLNNSWDNIYFAGEQIDACLRGTMKYFANLSQPNITLLGAYSGSRDGREILLTDEGVDIIKKIAYDFMDLNKGREAKKQLTKALFSVFDKPVIDSEGEMVFRDFNNIRKMIGFESANLSLNYESPFS